MTAVGNPYEAFVREFAETLDRARALPYGGLAPAARRAPKAGAPRALIIAPHPDDESIVGALPLRLQRELGWSVGVVPATLGSRTERRAPRLAELRGACAFLGWDVVDVPGSPAKAADLAKILKAAKPRLVLMPHAEDANATHRRTHRLVLDALAAAGRDLRCAVAETEFWSTMADPNLLVESSARETALLVAALSFHAGEVGRNPYHVLLPCWLADGARRGAELVGGAGAAATPCRFATLYRLGRWNGARLSPRPARIVAAGADLAFLLD
jgi:hypothetical protein